MAEKTHVVIVEDEVIIAMDIQRCLETFGYIVDDVCTDADEALECIKSYRPDIVLMDIILEGDKDGTEIVDTIQEELSIPVVYVTAHSDENTLKRAQVTRPYGYIVKPVDENQLHSTIQIALFKSQKELGHTTTTYIKDNQVFLGTRYVYSLTDKQLYRNDEAVLNAVDLTKKERHLLDLLIDQMNTTVSYDMLEKIIWSEKPVTTATLRSLVRRVRDKLDEELIENVTSLGYRIMVNEISPDL